MLIKNLEKRAVHTRLVAILFSFFKTLCNSQSKFPILQFPIPPPLTDLPSMSFSVAFSTPFHVCSQTRTSFCHSLASWPSMAPTFIPSVKTSLGSSKSAFLSLNLPLQSPISRRAFSKDQSYGVSARAATEKSIYDFTVKVLFCVWLRCSSSLLCNGCGGLWLSAVYLVVCAYFRIVLLWILFEE